MGSKSLRTKISSWIIHGMMEN